MYNNIGGKLKGLAIFVFICGTVASILLGILLLDQIQGLSLALCAGGIILALAFSWILYGIGEAVDNTYKIIQQSNGDNNKWSPAKATLIKKSNKNVVSKIELPAVDEAKKKYAEGEITKDEYELAVKMAKNKL